MNFYYLFLLIIAFVVFATLGFRYIMSIYKDDINLKSSLSDNKELVEKIKLKEKLENF